MLPSVPSKIQSRFRRVASRVFVGAPMLAALLLLSPAVAAQEAPSTDADAASKDAGKNEGTPKSEKEGEETSTTPSAKTITSETTAPASEKTRPRILVTDLKNLGASEAMASAINAAVAAQARISFDGDVTVVQEVRAKLELSANKILSGCNDDACFFNAAKVVGADVVLGGTIGKVGEEILINIIVVNGRDGTRKNQVQRKTPQLQELATFSAEQATAIAITDKPTSAKVPVVIRISQSLNGAEVSVDGEPRGAPPISLSLTPGSHRIQVTAAGHAPYRTTITVEPGNPILLEATLAGDTLELWPVAVGMGAASAVAIAAGVGFGAFAQLAYNGTVAGFPLGNPDESYAFQAPVTSVELAEKEQTISLLSTTSNALTLFVGPALIVGAVGFVVADFVLGSAAAE